MTKVILIIFLFISYTGFSQSEQIALDYFNRGEYEKALIAYQNLLEANKHNSNYFHKIVSIHQQLENYDEAESMLKKLLDTSKSPTLLVELGYNSHLKNDTLKAAEYYNKAISKIDENPNYVYNIASQFKQHSLLDKTIICYKKGKELLPKNDFNLLMARVYGEQGKIELMFSSYLAAIEKRSSYLSQAKRGISGFVFEDKQHKNNVSLKKMLLKKVQTQPEVHWYELLSWLYTQEKEYKKAFIQEKALYKRKAEGLNRIFELAMITYNQKQYPIAVEIFEYLTETAQDNSTKLMAFTYLLDIEALLASKEEYVAIDKKYNDLLTTYGKIPQTTQLQIAYAHFLTFYNNAHQKASAFLKETLALNLSPNQKAEVKLKLADILVFEEKFNEALIYYTQIQNSLKNSTISQEARFRVAKTSYYKGDFDWAESQLKVLKSSTSQLIANDALDLKLLISDNKQEDSLQTALKLYAKADLVAYQNKTEKAIGMLDELLQSHKGETIEAQALYKQGQLFEKVNNYEKAAANYDVIILNYGDGIIADDAHYALAELYNNHLDKPEKAKPLYEKIIFNYQDSIYFVEARKKYRALRGDSIN